MRLIAKLLHFGNANPPHKFKKEFYALKDRILSKYGIYSNQDIQHVVKPCGHCQGFGGATSGCFECEEMDDCCVCFGSGIYNEFWVFLDVYVLDGYLFHTPTKKVSIKPQQEILEQCGRVEGYIKHKDYGVASTEAFLWLCLIFDIKLFFRAIGKLYIGVYSLKYPLGLINNLVSEILNIKEFPKRYRTWQKKRYLKKMDRLGIQVNIHDDIPF